MKTIKMQHEITGALEERSGVKGLKLIRLKGYDPSWALGGIRDPAIDSATEQKLQKVLAELQRKFDMA